MKTRNMLPIVVLASFVACEENGEFEWEDEEMDGEEIVPDCIRHVDPNAGQGGDGLSWETAIPTLERGVVAAEESAKENGVHCEVWVKDDDSADSKQEIAPVHSVVPMQAANSASVNLVAGTHRPHAKAADRLVSVHAGFRGDETVRRTRAEQRTLNADGNADVVSIGGTSTSLDVAAKSAGRFDYQNVTPTPLSHTPPYWEYNAGHIYFDSGYVSIGTDAPTALLTIDDIYSYPTSPLAAMGRDSSATGAGAVAMGMGSSASGYSSFAVGSNNTAVDRESIAMGYGCYADEGASQWTRGAVAMGYQSSARDGGRLALGSHAEATGEEAVAIGYVAQATGTRSTAIGGYATKASGTYSFAVGLGINSGYDCAQYGAMCIMGGKVGIDTTTPSSELEVNGEIAASGLDVSGDVAAGSLDVEGNILGGRLELPDNDANGDNNSGSIEIGNTLRIDGNEILRHGSGTLYLQHGNNGDLRVDNGTLLVDSSENTVHINGDFNADSTTLFVDSSENAVGVGTSEPENGLHIVSSEVTFVDPWTHYYDELIIEDRYQSVMNIVSSHSGSSEISFSDEDERMVGALVYDHDENSFKVRVASATRMKFENDGDVVVYQRLIPDSHKGADLGYNGRAWDDIYYDDLHNQGAYCWEDYDLWSWHLDNDVQTKTPGMMDHKKSYGAVEMDPSNLPEKMTDRPKLIYKRAELRDGIRAARNLGERDALQARLAKIPDPEDMEPSDHAINTNNMVSANFVVINDLVKKVDRLETNMTAQTLRLLSQLNAQVESLKSIVCADHPEHEVCRNTRR